jgi:hypothetical protein
MIPLVATGVAAFEKPVGCVLILICVVSTLQRKLTLGKQMKQVQPLPAIHQHEILPKTP